MADRSRRLSLRAILLRPGYPRFDHGGQISGTRCCSVDSRSLAGQRTRGSREVQQSGGRAGTGAKGAGSDRTGSTLPFSPFETSPHSLLLQTSIPSPFPSSHSSILVLLLFNIASTVGSTSAEGAQRKRATMPSVRPLLTPQTSYPLPFLPFPLKTKADARRNGRTQSKGQTYARSLDLVRRAALWDRKAPITPKGQIVSSSQTSAEGTCTPLPCRFPLLDVQLCGSWGSGLCCLGLGGGRGGCVVDARELAKPRLLSRPPPLSRRICLRPLPPASPAPAVSSTDLFQSSSRQADAHAALVCAS